MDWIRKGQWQLLHHNQYQQILPPYKFQFPCQFYRIRRRSKPQQYLIEDQLHVRRPLCTHELTVRELQ